MEGAVGRVKVSGSEKVNPPTDGSEKAAGAAADGAVEKDAQGLLLSPLGALVAAARAFSTSCWSKARAPVATVPSLWTILWRCMWHASSEWRERMGTRCASWGKG